MLETKPIGTVLGKSIGLIVQSDESRNAMALDRDEVIELFKRHGALLFRGFDFDGERDFRAFTEVFGRDFISYPALTRGQVSEDNTTQTVDDTTQAIPLHSELSYLPAPLCPEMCWFLCVRPPAVNGQTLLCDGLFVHPFLAEEVRKSLEERRLKYVMEFSVQTCLNYFQADSLSRFYEVIERHSLQHVFRVEDDMVYMDRVSPVFTRSKFGAEKVLANNIVNNGRGASVPVFEDGSIIPDYIYDELQSVTDRLTVEVDWQPNDLLIVDNTRVMHGRREIEDELRLIHTRFCSTNF
jgi:alpha-ketoglutarate-dependent taurine dioxygenase